MGVGRVKRESHLSTPLDNALYLALMDVVGQDLAFAAVDAVERVLCAPPPEVYEFYRAHARWPAPEEA